MNTARRFRAVHVLLGVALLALAQPLSAQGGFGGGFGGGRGGGDIQSALWGIPDIPTGFYVCRLAFDTTANDRSGSGWRIEYPRADINFMTRLNQLTTTDIAYWRDGRSGGIGHTVVRATDPELFACPWLVMSSPGSVGFSAAEAEALREFLLRGGFLWADDFWGNGPWNHWMGELNRILPEYEVELLTAEHPIFSFLYRIPEMPQIPSLNRWRPGMPTQEEPGEEFATPTAHGVFDESGRLMVLITHNTDINDGFEREADLDQFFQEFAWKAYSFGMNVAMWAMTH